MDLIHVLAMIGYMHVCYVIQTVSNKVIQNPMVDKNCVTESAGKVLSYIFKLVEVNSTK